MKSQLNLKKDMNIMLDTYSQIVEDIGVFGSFINPNVNAHDIDIVIKLKDGKSLPTDIDFRLLDLSLPVVQIDINCYRRQPVNLKYGYHLLLLSTEEAKSYFDIINRETVIYRH